MPSERPIHRVACLAFALLSAACNDSTAPVSKLTVSICGDFDLAAYQNENQAWKLLGHGNGTYTFNATHRLAIAKVRYGAWPSDAIVTLDYLTAEQAAERFK